MNVVNVLGALWKERGVAEDKELWDGSLRMDGFRQDSEDVKLMCVFCPPQTELAPRKGLEKTFQEVVLEAEWAWPSHQSPG